MCPGETFNIIVLLHSDCHKNHVCYQFCLQRTSLEDEHKYQMSAESKESTTIQSTGMRTVYLKAFWTPKIGLTGMMSSILQMTAKTTGRQTMNST